MIHETLQVQKRTILGNSVKKIRKEGLIPGVVYGNKTEPKSISVEKKDFHRLYKKAGMTSIVDLKIDLEKALPCIIHDLDFHPVTEEIRHMDFLAVDLKSKIITEVPIELTGDAPGVKELGAVLVASLDTLEIECLPEDIPHTIKIDVSNLKTLDDVIHISDLEKSPKYEILNDLEETIASLSVENNEVSEEAVDTIVETGKVEEEAQTDNSKSNK
jgi:large subunit ribosomal protein L25